MTTSSRLWVLGASDPEMALIESLLVEAGQQVAYAAVQGVKGACRVHPGNAYKAEGVLPIQPGIFDAFPVADEIILVECGFHSTHPYRVGTVSEYTDQQAGGPIFFCSSGLEEHSRDFVVLRIDHHRTGDPGYGKPPEEFLSASSVGQVLQVLHRGATTGVFCFTGAATGWQMENDVGYPEWAVNLEIVLAAAADHCLEAAYRGKCPGVDPNILMGWRVCNRARQQNRDSDAVLADIRKAMAAIEVAIQKQAVIRVPPTGEAISKVVDLRTIPTSEDDVCHTCGYARREHTSPHGTCPGTDDNGWPSFDTGGYWVVPELPEAACRMGVPYLATVLDPDGRRKVVLGAAPPEVVKEFLSGEIVPGLFGLYGDPARGFAGGYLL